VTGIPPVSVGGRNVTVALLFAPVALTIIGGSGGPAGVNCLDIASGDGPTALKAAINAVYLFPFVSPVTVTGFGVGLNEISIVTDDIPLVDRIVDTNSFKYKIGLPPSDNGFVYVITAERFPGAIDVKAGGPGTPAGIAVRILEIVDVPMTFVAVTHTEYEEPSVSPVIGILRPVPDASV
jgi:hypothetical protein